MILYMFLAGLLSLITSCQQPRKSSTQVPQSLDQKLTKSLKAACQVERPSSQRLGCYPVEATLRCQLRDARGKALKFTAKDFAGRISLPEELKAGAGFDDAGFHIKFTAEGTKEGREKLLAATEVDLSKDGDGEPSNLNELLGNDRDHLLAILCADGPEIPSSSVETGSTESESPEPAQTPEQIAMADAYKLIYVLNGKYSLCEVRGQGSVRTEVNFVVRGVNFDLQEQTFPKSKNCSGEAGEITIHHRGNIDRIKELGSGRFAFTLTDQMFEVLSQHITYVMKQDPSSKDLTIESLTAFIPNSRDPSKNDRESTIDLGLRLKQTWAP